MTDEQTDQPTEPDEQSGTDAAGASADDDGQTSLLDRAAASIDEARDAEGVVAAHDDITTLDDERAGAYSEDPGGEGGHP